MSDGALSETAMLISLRDIRLPPEAAGGVVADVAVTLGLAALIAFFMAGLARAVSQRKITGQTPSLRAQIAGLSDQPEPERRVALLHLLRAHAPDRYVALRGDIYAPGGGVDPDTLEAEVQRLV